jgi:hypothetical protein
MKSVEFLLWGINPPNFLYRHTTGEKLKRSMTKEELQQETPVFM